MTLDKRTNTSNAFGKSIKRVMLKIRDTAGQEEMVSLLDRHLEGQDAGKCTFKKLKKYFFFKIINLRIEVNLSVRFWISQ